MLRAVRELDGLDVRCGGPGHRQRLADTSRHRRRLFGFALQRSLLDLLLLGRERGGNRAAPLTVEIGGVLFVDVSLFFGVGLGPAMSKLRFCMKSK